MFESKQLRTEKKIFRKLRKKFNHAFLIERKHSDTTTKNTFIIDNKFVIVFESATLIVSRQDTTEKLISIDCGWYGGDPESRHRSLMYKCLLGCAINASDKLRIKQEKMQKQQKAAEAAIKAQEQKIVYINNLTRALGKLK